ncbi:MAG: glycosyltransferase family 2 protein [bacterium]|nr:glycosyltransferase family 2 protein [bacterium]
MKENNQKTVSVIVPACNEAGTIEKIVTQIPKLGARMEIIFVEGNSKDNTREKIKMAISLHPERDIKLYAQEGSGKGNAVRKGFEKAHGDILMILDADLSVEPEALVDFYREANKSPQTFVNGTRMKTPMEAGAMPFLNKYANKAFAYIFSSLTGSCITDTLCGTKAIYREQYEKILTLNFSPYKDQFGDFELILGASLLGLEIVEIPIHYKRRQYGKTNISRWRDGLLLLGFILGAFMKTGGFKRREATKHND